MLPSTVLSQTNKHYPRQLGHGSELNTGQWNLAIGSLYVATPYCKLDFDNIDMGHFVPADPTNNPKHFLIY